MIPIVKSRNSQQIADILANYDLPVFEFASLRITFGMLVVYSTLFGFVAFVGLMTVDSAGRYWAISSYCHSAAAS